MNYIWSGMMLVGIVYGILSGRVGEVSEALISSGREAVSLCVTMCGVMALWSGLMEIANDAGLLRVISRRIRPVMRYLFPEIPQGRRALEYITTNCVANVLGLGSASTVYGLKAMEALEELEKERRETYAGFGEFQNASKGTHTLYAMPCGTASDEMCDFLILNISSLQLIPVTIIAYRSQYGSVNPTAIVGPGIVATAVSTGVAVTFCRILHVVVQRKRTQGDLH